MRLLEITNTAPAAPLCFFVRCEAGGFGVALAEEPDCFWVMHSAAPDNRAVAPGNRAAVWFKIGLADADAVAAWMTSQDVMQQLFDLAAAYAGPAAQHPPVA